MLVLRDPLISPLDNWYLTLSACIIVPVGSALVLDDVGVYQKQLIRKHINQLAILGQIGDRVSVQIAFELR